MFTLQLASCVLDKILLKCGYPRWVTCSHIYFVLHSILFGFDQHSKNLQILPNLIANPKQRDVDHRFPTSIDGRMLYNRKMNSRWNKNIQHRCPGQWICSKLILARLRKNYHPLARVVKQNNESIQFLALPELKDQTSSLSRFGV